MRSYVGDEAEGPLLISPGPFKGQVLTQVFDTALDCVRHSIGCIDIVVPDAATGLAYD